jgi:hypothetical protein
MARVSAGCPLAAALRDEGLVVETIDDGTTVREAACSTFLRRASYPP